MEFELIESQNRKNYIIERASIGGYKRKIIANPEKPVDNYLRLEILITLGVALVCLIFFVMIFIPAGIGFKVVSAILFALMMFFFGIHLFVVVSIIRAVFSKKKVADKTVIEMDEEGISVNGSTVKTKVLWSAVKFIKECKHSLAMIPSDNKTKFLIFPVENFENIEKYILENGIDVKIIKNK